VVVRRWRGAPQHEGAGWFDRPRQVGIAVALALAVSLTWYVPLRLFSNGSSGESGFRSHVLLALASAAAAVVAVAVQARLCDDADAGRGAAGPAEGATTPGSAAALGSGRGEE
jgi:hypothetical protein